MSKITKKVPVEVQNRSGFDCSHSNSFTAKCGTLVPILCDHVMPNTTINLDVACEVNLPPAVSDFYGSIEARMEFFYVPYRVLWAGWKYFFTQPPQGGIVPGIYSHLQIKELPRLDIPVASQNLFYSGSLADMLGFKGFQPTSTTPFSIPNILPFIGYHKIYDDFYRDSRLTQPIFFPVARNGQSSGNKWYNLPFLSGVQYDSGGTVQYFEADEEIMSFRQRCWDKDYFTNATYSPQAGDAVSLEFEVSSDGDTSTGSFTISSIRVANSLQRFAEVNNLAGQRAADQQYARFGCYPSDAALDRPIYLGQKRFNVYKRSVYQQNQVQDANNGDNPFSGQLGNKTSALSGYGEGFLGKFHAKDPGMIYVIFSLVPKATYSTGTRRYLLYSKLTDFPEPLLQGTGDQPIYQCELINQFIGTISRETFGYTQRYAEAKFMSDEVHGLLRDGQTLDMFQLQRTFNSQQSLGTEFIEIPTDYLDQVTTHELSVSNFGCWCNAYFNFKKVQPLAAYSLPTLGDPKDTHTVIIDAGGKRL